MAGTFQAFEIHGKENGKLVQKELTEPARDEVRVKVKYVGICGSDIHYYFEGTNGSFAIQEPLIPGHEISGVIDSDSSGTFPQGTPVTIHPAQSGEFTAELASQPHLWKGVRYLGSAATTPHTQGGLAEYLILKREMIRPLPEGVSLKAGALAEPLSVALHGISLAGELSGKNILVSGSGPIGLLTILALRTLKPAQITAIDIVDEALVRAQQLGADECINVQRETLSKDSWDVVFECSGSARAVNNAIAAVRRGGVIVQVGMLGLGLHEIDFGSIVTKEIRVHGAFRFNNEMSDALSLLEQNPEIERCISHEFPIESWEEAFRVAKDSKASGKVVIALNVKER